MKLLDRYVFIESIQLLLIGSVIILGIFFGTSEFQKYLNMMNDFGFPLEVVLSVILLQIPNGICFCLPAGVLFSTMFLLIRQQDDSEILALQVAGIRLERIMIPYVIFSIFAGSSAFWLSEYIAPQCRMLSERYSLIALYSTAQPFAGRFKLEQRDQNGSVSRVFFFGEELGKTVNGLLLLDFTEKGVVNAVFADTGKWEKGAWCLSGGQIFELFNQVSQNRVARFAVMQQNNPGLLEAIKAGPQTILAKTTKQLKAEIDSYRDKNMAAPKELLFQYYRRYSHPFSCILLVLAATPVALMRGRRSRSTSWVYAGLVISSYFVLQQICMSLAENNRLDSLVGAWLPALILCIFGIMLTLLLSHRR